MTPPASAPRFVSRAQQQLVLRASRKALEVRSNLGIPLTSALSAPQAAQDLGIEVRYVNIASMEGMYCRISEPKILISSCRPPGRQAFTAGHELGHHLFGHGEHIHELLEQRDGARRYTPEERLADAFSACLLMPKSAVVHAFSVRGNAPASCCPADVYRIAWWFGVGYETLIQHMRLTLGLITDERSRSLLRHSPKSIRAELLGQQTNEDLIPVDFHWSGRAIDTQVGDLIRLPSSVQVEGTCVEVIHDRPGEALLLARRPGVGRLVAEDRGWAAYVRVSRRAFEGRAAFRFLEDDDGD